MKPSALEEHREAAIVEGKGTLRHVAPFAVWLAAMYLLPTDAVGYAVRSMIVAGVLLICIPWRSYARPGWGDLVFGVLCGAAVYALWVVPELPLTARRWPVLHDAYMRYAVWGDAQGVRPSPFDPRQCGWVLTLARLAGSALVIAVAEEFFWRGFVYRWLISPRFLRVDIGRFEVVAFLIMIALFGVEHRRWLAGALAGAAYGALMIKRRNIGAAVTAHVTTNLLLGVHVLAFDAYGFW